MTEEKQVMEQKEFYEILNRIFEYLDEPEEDCEYFNPNKKKCLISDLETLIYKSEASESVKEDLKIVLNKIIEARLWIKRLGESLAKYD